MRPVNESSPAQGAFHSNESVRDFPTFKTPDFSGDFWIFLRVFWSFPRILSLKLLDYLDFLQTFLIVFAFLGTSKDFPGFFRDFHCPNFLAIKGYEIFGGKYPSVLHTCILLWHRLIEMNWEDLRNVSHLFHIFFLQKLFPGQPCCLSIYFGEWWQNLLVHVCKLLIYWSLQAFHWTVYKCWRCGMYLAKFWNMANVESKPTKWQNTAFNSVLPRKYDVRVDKNFTCFSSLFSSVVDAWYTNSFTSEV